MCPRTALRKQMVYSFAVAYADSHVLGLIVAYKYDPMIWVQIILFHTGPAKMNLFFFHGNMNYVNIDRAHINLYINYFVYL